jgi:CheY-like chemotaxis protein
MLYFKYLQAKNQIKDEKETKELLSPTRKGKVLFIDDEWEKGWNDVLAGLYDNYPKIEFQTFKYDFKDKTEINLFLKIKESVEKFNPDVVILDLRLSQNDHNENIDIDNFLGMDILKKIHKINEGIQVIMLTATSKSTILEKLYEKNILGYIKKEHPRDTSINTIETINKFVSLVDKGLERSYLKNIFLTQSKIESILENDIFVQYISDEEKYEPFWIQLQVETTQVFDILSNSSSQNKFKYAMVSIASSMEAILSIFITESRDSDNKYWDGERCSVNTLNTKLSDLFYSKFGYEQQDKYRSKLKMKGMIDKRNKYLHAREEVAISKEEIVSWFNKLLKMIEIIEKPPLLRKYDVSNIVQNLNDAFNER